MHEKVLPKNSVGVLNALTAADAAGLAPWTLAGGTGLALQLGHRVSEDFDFFRTDAIDVRALHAWVGAVGPYETLQEAEHTLTVLVRRTKLSFFRVRDPFIFETLPYRGFQLADIREIALMKLIAISGRGARKDFIDLRVLLRGPMTLRECLEWLPRKYGAQRINRHHLLKSLTYFDDAEREPLPRMLEPFDWKACKGFFQREAHRLVLPGA